MKNNMDPLFIYIGKRIKIQRIKKDISAHELASRLDITRNYLSLIENGHVSASIIVYAKIANELDIKLSELFD